MNKIISNNYSTWHCWEQWLAALRWSLWTDFVPLAIFQRMSERGYWLRERTPVRSWPIESRSYWRELPGRRSCCRDTREILQNSGKRHTHSFPYTIVKIKTAHSHSNNSKGTLIFLRGIFYHKLEQLFSSTSQSQIEIFLSSTKSKGFLKSLYPLFIWNVKKNFQLLMKVLSRIIIKKTTTVGLFDWKSALKIYVQLYR